MSIKCGFVREDGTEVQLRAGCMIAITDSGRLLVTDTDGAPLLFATYERDATGAWKIRDQPRRYSDLPASGRDHNLYWTSNIAALMATAAGLSFEWAEDKERWPRHIRSYDSCKRVYLFTS